jgi:hypothetical protein
MITKKKPATRRARKPHEPKQDPISAAIDGLENATYRASNASALLRGLAEAKAIETAEHAEESAFWHGVKDVVRRLKDDIDLMDQHATTLANTFAAEGGAR